MASDVWQRCNRKNAEENKRDREERVENVLLKIRHQLQNSAQDSAQNTKKCCYQRSLEGIKIFYKGDNKIVTTI